MSISGDHVAARNAGVLVEGLQQWEADGGVERLNGQTAADQGFSHPEAGTESVGVTMMLVIDITAGSFVALKQGSVIEGLQLFAHTDSLEPIYDIPSFLVLKCTPMGEMGGRFTCRVSGENQGPFTMNDPN